MRSIKLIKTVACGALLTFGLAVPAMAQDDVIIIQNNQTARIPTSELQNRVTNNGAELLSGAAMRANGREMVNTSFLGRIRGEKADVTVTFNPAFEVESGPEEVDCGRLYFKKRRDIVCYWQKSWFPREKAKKSGNDNNRSGLGDGTNPGQGAGRENATNEGTNNPNNAGRESTGTASSDGEVDDGGSDYANWGQVKKYINGFLRDCVVSELSKLRNDIRKNRSYCRGWPACVYASLTFGKDGWYRLSVYIGVYYSTANRPAEGLTVCEEIQEYFETSMPDDKRWNPETDMINLSAMRKAQGLFAQMLRPFVNFRYPTIQELPESERYAELEASAALYFQRPSRSSDADRDRDLIGDLINAFQLGGLTRAQRRQSETTSLGSEANFFIRIGDVDGFGFGAAEGYDSAAKNVKANKDGVGVLGTGDQLPDLHPDRNKRGTYRDVRTSLQGSKYKSHLGRDDFDLRSSEELSNSAVFMKNAQNICTLGSKFTDVALSTSYDQCSDKRQIWDGSKWGKGKTFPKGRSQNKPNMPGFVFEFKVPAGVLVPGQAIFFNLVFGDYDVKPAHIQITRLDGSVRVLPLVAQENSKNEDGLIQAAFVQLAFDDVFRQTSDGGYYGLCCVDMVAPNEPYVTFDFVELSTEAIDITGNDNKLRVIGHLVYGPEGAADMNVTSHAGELRKSEVERPVPESVIDDSEEPEDYDFEAGVTTISSSQTLSSMNLESGATVVIDNGGSDDSIVLNVLGPINVPKGARIVIGDETNVQINSSGSVFINGVVDNAFSKNLTIDTTLDSKQTGTGVTVNLYGGRFIGAIIGRNVRLSSKDGGVIRFSYDKALASQFLQAKKDRLRVKAVLDDDQ